MEIDYALKIVSDVAVKNLIDKPYIVGGLPRDVYLGKTIKTTDIDLTTNSPDILRLGILVADVLNVPFELADDGHVTVFTDSFDLDFSSNFESPGVLEHLDEEKRKFAEAYSRDFTINTLHQDLVSREIVDPTSAAFKDIDEGVIRTPVSPEVTLRDDPRRIYRAINLAVRYNFDISEEIKEFVLKNPDLFTSENVKDKYITIKLTKALKIDADRTISLLKELNLFKNVPLVGAFKDVLIEKRLLAEYLRDV
nr:hypothetical protein 48 [bacterium]